MGQQPWRAVKSYNLRGGSGSGHYVGPDRAFLAGLTQRNPPAVVFCFGSAVEPLPKTASSGSSWILVAPIHVSTLNRVKDSKRVWFNPATPGYACEDTAAVPGEPGLGLPAGTDLIVVAEIVGVY